MAYINKVHTTLRNIKPGTDIVVTVARPGYRAFQNVKITNATVVEYDDETLTDPVASTSFMISTPDVVISTVFGSKTAKHIHSNNEIAYVIGESIRFANGYDTTQNTQWTIDYDIIDARGLSDNEF